MKAIDICGANATGSIYLSALQRQPKTHRWLEGRHKPVLNCDKVHIRPTQKIGPDLGQGLLEQRLVTDVMDLQVRQKVTVDFGTDHVAVLIAFGH